MAWCCLSTTLATFSLFIHVILNTMFHVYLQQHYFVSWFDYPIQPAHTTVQSALACKSAGTYTLASSRNNGAPPSCTFKIPQMPAWVSIFLSISARTQAFFLLRSISRSLIPYRVSDCFYWRFEKPEQNTFVLFLYLGVVCYSSIR